MTTWWCEVLGGPADYTQRLGGYPAMLAHHRDLGITPGQRFRFASLMSLAADDADLPGDPEFRAAFVSYLEWGTRLAMHNSQPGADIAQQAPVPRWGWGVAHRPTSPDGNSCFSAARSAMNSRQARRHNVGGVVIDHQPSEREQA